MTVDLEAVADRLEALLDGAEVYPVPDDLSAFDARAVCNLIGDTAIEALLKVLRHAVAGRHKRIGITGAEFDTCELCGDDEIWPCPPYADAVAAVRPLLPMIGMA